MAARDVYKRQDIKRYLTELYGGFMWRAENVMIKYGPRAMEYLYTGEGAECSIQQIMELSLIHI